MSPGRRTRDLYAPPRAAWPAWIAWSLVLLSTTAVLLSFRASLNEAQVALSYLLIVQLGAAQHGRTLGLTLAGLAFVAFDVLFLPPYGTLMVTKSVDWMVLLAFLVTCVVTAQLFERSRAEAADARRRTDELDRLSMLGAETLNAPRAEDALSAIASVIRGSLDLTWCAIWDVGGGQGVRELVTVRREGAGDTSAEQASMVQRVATDGRALGMQSDIGRTLVTGAEGIMPFEPLHGSLRVAALPLQVRDRLVGVLLIARDPALDLHPAHARMLGVLSYYASLGVERVGLAARAEHADALREAARMKDAVVASVSHDLRTPLTTIKALAHEMAMAGDERASVIEDEADRLNKFVADLLDLSRLSAGVPLSPEPNEAEDLIGAALQRIGAPIGGGRVTVRLTGGEALLLGRFDFGQTLRALVNVLDNALKYAPDDSAVELAADRHGDWLEFRVSDRGPGVSEDARELIFEPFYRPASASPDAGGVGLGLSIARAIARGQGGELSYEPREGGGAVFVLCVPFVELSALGDE